MGFYGLRTPSSGSNIRFGFCTKYKYITSATNINELRGEIKENGINVQDDNGNVKHYDDYDSLFDDFPSGLIIVRKCPQNIGNATLIQETPVYDSNGYLIRYNCKYDCVLCDNLKSCGSIFCIGFSKNIIGCKDENGKCNYYSSDGSSVSDDDIEQLNCNCEDPVWVMEKDGDNVVVKSYSKKTGKECNSGELLINKNTISCGKEILLKEGLNFINDPNGNGIVIRINPVDIEKYSDCQIFYLYVNDNLAFSDSVLAIKENPPIIDITQYNVFGTYKIEYKVE